MFQQNDMLAQQNLLNDIKLNALIKIKQVTGTLQKERWRLQMRFKCIRKLNMKLLDTMEGPLCLAFHSKLILNHQHRISKGRLLYHATERRQKKTIAMENAHDESLVAFQGSIANTPPPLLKKHQDKLAHPPC